MNLKSNFIINILAFAIFMLAQQIVIMPQILKISGENIFADTVLLFTLVNIFLYLSVYSIGNTYLIKANLYKKENKSLSDFNLIVLLIIAVICILTIVSILFAVIPFYSIIVGAAAAISVLRVWSEFQYRYENNYQKILLQNFLYLLGSLAIFIDYSYKFYNIPFIYFLIAEITALIAYAEKALTIFNKIVLSKEFKNTCITFWNISLQTATGNIASYFDRFFLYPVFGAFTLNFYYAVTLASKTVYLFVTPVSSVLSGYLANVDESEKIHIFRYLKNVSRKYFIILVIASLLISFVILKFLYSQYFIVGVGLLPAIAVSTALDCLTGIYLLVCRRFFNAKKLTVISLIKIIIFALCAGVIGYYFGITGVINGILVSNIITFTIYYFWVKNILSNK